MKSAYELAMERLGKSDTETKLTPEKKARLAELDSLYKGKIAEREIFLNQRLNELLVEGEMTESEKVRGQIIAERKRLEEERDAEKDAVRRGR